MQPEQQDVNAEILARLERIEDGVKATNGRVTALEGWQVAHESWTDEKQRLLEQHREAIESMQEHFTKLTLAVQTTPSNLEHAVAKVLDRRQTTENAAKYAALVKRFGHDPEENLARWGGLQAGFRAVGWKVMGAVLTVLVIALLAAVFSIWAVSLRGGA